MTDLIKDLFSYRMDVRFFTDAPVQMRYWIGAVLRNRFLFAAESVHDENGMSLRSIIDTLTLPEDHFLYRQLRGGFPKGFLFDCSSLPRRSSGFTLDAGRVYSFSLILIGSNIMYRPLFEEALRIMLDNGFGTPAVPMHLIEINPGEAMRMEDAWTGSGTVGISLEFKTPVCLMSNATRAGNGFQNKLNGFPSFYQFMRSLSYRLVTLGMLYSNGAVPGNKDEMDGIIEDYISASGEAVLASAEIVSRKCYSTPKKGKDTVYSMSGYTGRLCFDNVQAHYIPFIRFGSGFGVGMDINYGLGSFCIDTLH